MTAIENTALAVERMGGEATTERTPEWVQRATHAKPELRVAGGTVSAVPGASRTPPALDEMDLVFDEEAKVVWQYMRPSGRPSFTHGLLRDMARALDWVRQLCGPRPNSRDLPVHTLVMASRMKGIFNLGGDLPSFVALIRAGDESGLRRYAHACIDVQYPRAINLNLPIVTISLVQGDALGGGFEAALADDVIIAEHGAKFGLPEILFNLFPGMGAYSFLARRIDPARAERLILSGRLYGADELCEMGVIDQVVDDGAGESAVHDFIERGRRTFNGRQSVHQVRRMVNPVSRDELIGVTELWVQAALRLGGSDLRKMERLATAQDRRWAGTERALAV